MHLKKITNENLKTIILYFIDVVLNRPNLKNGLITTPFKKIDQEGDFIYSPGRLGFVEKKVLKEDGDYRGFRPDGEQQNVGSDKMHCVSESACNNIETRVNYYLFLIDNGKASKDQTEVVNIFKHFGLIKNGKCLLSTRYVAAGSGTTVRGNSQKAVADFIRHYGLVAKDDYPYVNDWNEYYYTGDRAIKGNKLPSGLMAKGQRLIEYVEFNYEWVAPLDIPETYPLGPMQNIAYAWYGDVSGILKRNSYTANHAFQGDGKKPTYQQIFDSYYPFDKKAALNFYKEYGMLYTFKAKKTLSKFNTAYIKELKKRGLEYILLVNKFEDYDPGAYKLLDTGLEKADLKVVLDNGIKKLALEGKLTGISTQDFAKILNK